MPGINFICALNKDLESKRKASQQVLENMLYEENYFSEVLLDDQAYILSCVKYEKYPVTCFENDEFFICLEGKIYSEEKDCLKDGLIRLARELFSGRKDIKEFLADWLLNIDGEFVIFMLHKPTRRIVIINDVFSRLPIYCYHNNGSVIISRNHHFITSLINNRQFDMMAIAQLLLFNFALGKRTYVKNVHRVAPATLIRINPKSGEFQKDIVYTFNFDIKKHKSKSVRENAQALVPLYLKACAKRVDPDSKTIVSLSGGLDSRTVASSLKKAGLEFETASFLDSGKIARFDVMVAERVSNILGVKWEKYELKPGQANDMLTLLKIKNGLVPLEGPHSFQYFRRLKEKYGRGLTLFSGNGGDRIARDIRPVDKIRNLDDLTRYTLFRDGANLTGIPIEVVSALTGISKEEFVKELKNYLENLPEKDPVQKAIHNNIYGQLCKLHHEGEDRKRHFFWGTSPYWSVDLFKYWMNCPDKQKKNKRLYTTVISQLNWEVSEVPYANNQATALTPIAKNKDAFWQLVMRIKKWPNPVRFVIRKVKKIFKQREQAKKYNHPPALIACLKEQLAGCQLITENLSGPALEEMISNIEKYNARSLAVLFTVTSLIEYISTDKSSVEKFLGSELDSYFLRPK